MKKTLHNFLLIVCILLLLPQTIYADSSDTTAVPTTTTDSLSSKIVFPIKFNRATGDDIISTAADEKGSILIVTNNYLNITHDYGKTWVSRSLPSSGMYAVRYLKGKFYLSTMHVDQYYSVIRIYASSNGGDEWTKLSLTAKNGQPVTIGSLQYLNGKYVMLGTQVLNERTPVYTSTDGFTWNEVGSIPFNIGFLTWNGTRYSAFGGGYQLTPQNKSQQMTRNQFKLKNGNWAEMIVFTSNDLTEWTMQSGAIKKNFYYDSLYVNGKPYPVYDYQEEQPVTNGTIILYDYYGNRLKSTNGITFTMSSQADLFPTNDYRSPMFQVGKQYMIFTQYWYASGVMRLNVLTSTDKVHWKTTKLSRNTDNMWVYQAGSMLVGLTDKHLLLSSNGIDWKVVR
ncbi:hypothetical protein DFQ01_101174 [Paenibacillus cellulosilyticus]|uniref:BNR repeat protein n=1 Tax=Paenibacillus cellulosilyticus TaxID=375489 RepID=A0A2V2Z0Y0_9BACL|nr:hypothetical protein [Paenibacillus cellulosilyticus]PWW08452.1 hypothetical protein DFQ01_101174 [Paenibacillus cellulosilyticus]QKS48039.1 hypothetical protein HUB94_27505 [Paenibacillus cellulosilyticus]